MKSRRVLMSVVLVSLATLAFAQSEGQKSFDAMKTLAGQWSGPVSVNPPQPGMGDGTRTQVSLRVTSRGNALVHEMGEFGISEDPMKHDHPVTMLYMEGDRLYLTHYCDAGNRPRMAGKVSPDGKKVEFEFVDLAGGNQYGHMYHAVFTIIDANHHTEDWTYMMPGDKEVHAHIDLTKTN